MMPNSANTSSAITALLLAALPYMASAQEPTSEQLNRVRSYVFNGGNLVGNGFFENNHTAYRYEGWYPGFEKDFSVLSPLELGDDIQPYEGQQQVGVRYTCPTPASGKNPFRLMSDFFPLKPGVVYTLFFRYQARDLVLPGTAQIKPSVHFWKTRDFAFNPETESFDFTLGDDGGSSELFPTAFGSAYASQSAWTLSTLQFTAPAGVGYGNIFLLWASVEGAGGKFNFDEVYLTEGAVGASETSDPRHPANVDARTRFFNGNNKLIQTVTQDGDFDIVEHVFNDEFGRVTKSTLPIGTYFGVNKHKYIPGIKASADETDGTDLMNCFYRGSRKMQPCMHDVPLDLDPITGAVKYYPDANGHAFNETRFEDSPLGREVESSGPGSDWKMGSAHTIKTIYGSVINLAAGAEDELPPQVGAAGKFFVKEKTGTDGQVVREFTDQLGRIVRKSNKYFDGTETRWLHSDYQYDANGNATRLEAPESESARLVTDYEFDPLNRLLTENNLATGTTIFRYDEAGRLRFSQTANQNELGTFSFNKYDVLGRILFSGEILDETLLTQDNADIPEFPCIRDCVDPESEIELDKIKLRIVNHYDSEDAGISCEGGPYSPSPSIGFAFLARSPSGVAIAASYSITQVYQQALTILQGEIGEAEIIAIHNGTGDGIVEPDGNTEIVAAGELTFEIFPLSTETSEGEAAMAEFSEILKQQTSASLGKGEFLLGRIVKSISCNYELAEALGESRSREVSKTYRYDRTGNMTRILESNGYVHDAARRNQLSKSEYDIQGRLAKVIHCGNSACDDEVSHIEEIRRDQLGRESLILGKQGNILVHNNFNSIGQQSFQGLGGEISPSTSNALLKRTTYHLHGWLESTDVKQLRDATTVFSQSLQYNTGAADNRRFDGNIGAINYQYSNTIPLEAKGIAYKFKYDDLNRLVESDALLSDGSEANSSYAYLDDGRIVAMSRGAAGGTYDYYANGRLKEVTGDLVENRDLSLSGNNNLVFDYDLNGNLISDFSKKKAEQPLKICYRADNLPYKFLYKVLEPGGHYRSRVEYIAYDETGRRVSKLTKADANRLAEKSYFASGKEIRESNVMSTVELMKLANVGRVRYSESNPIGSKEYYLVDYLGSTRGIYDFTDGEVTFAAHYYPYGKVLSDFSSTEVPTERFAGKEFDHGTLLTYFGARYYDQDLALWISPDAVRASLNLYGYANGNPVAFTDPDGNEPVKNQLGSTARASKFLGKQSLQTDWYDPNKNPYRGFTKGRYIPASNVRGGFIDMNHFLAAAALAQKIGFGPIGSVSSYIGGVLLEVDQWKDKVTGDNPGRGKSAFSYEDIPSNDWGALFYLVYNPDEPLGPQVETFLNKWAGAQTPAEFKKSQPEKYKKLPEKEEP